MSIASKLVICAMIPRKVRSGSKLSSLGNRIFQHDLAGNQPVSRLSSLPCKRLIFLVYHSRRRQGSVGARIRCRQPSREDRLIYLNNLSYIRASTNTKVLFLNLSIPHGHKIKTTSYKTHKLIKKARHGRFSCPIINPATKQVAGLIRGRDGTARLKPRETRPGVYGRKSRH